MNGCKGSCITLAAIAGASAAIAGGILAVSSATAESAPASATVAARTTVSSTSRPVVDSEALAVSNSVEVAGDVVKVDDRAAVYFEDTFEGMRYRMRAQYARKLTREFLAATDYPVDSNTEQQLQGPVPCNLCDAAATVEDDVLPVVQNGSNLPDACTISGVVDIGWRGNNDHCLFPGDTLFEDPSLKEILPNFTGINQSVQFCGTTMNIDNSLHTGDANGASRDFDPDVWEYQIAGLAALDMQMTAYGEAEQIRIAMTYNFFDQTNNGEFGEIVDCSDGYGIFVFPVWQSFEIRTSAGCTDGTWAESLQEGYWYILCFPTSTGGGGPTAGCPTAGVTPAYHYNVTLEAIDPIGACCNTDTGICTDGSLKSLCFAGAGVFKGPGSDCASASCCSPILDLGATPADWEENNKADYGSQSEDTCNTSGEINLNEGCVQDFEGNLIKEAITSLTVSGAEFICVDICDATDPFPPGAGGPNGDGTYFIVGYGGTEDDFSASFSADSISQGDDDLFAFDIPGPDPVRIEAQFNVPYTYVGYIIRDLGNATCLAPDCDVVGFLSPGITAPCQLTRVSQCLNPGTHGVFMQVFQTANVDCTVRYTIEINCLPCPTGACCMPNGTCTDDLADPTCEFVVGGNYQGDYSSCCASTCAEPCTETPVNVPLVSDPAGQAATCTPPAVSDDDCTCYTDANGQTLVGDKINSGCEAPDGNQSAYWSVYQNANDALHCGFTGTYIFDSGIDRDFIGDVDYYELDLTGQAGDTQVAITVNSQLPLELHLVRERDRTECPSVGVDGTDDVRELPETISVGTGNIGGLNQITLTVCLTADNHMILLENQIIIGCGFSYTMQVDYEPQCLGACCIDAGPNSPCLNVAEDSTDAAAAPPLCDAEGGVYRGLGSRCPGTGGTNPLGNVTEIECCDVPCIAGDVIDSDQISEGGPGCAGIIANKNLDTNGGCAQGTSGTFQSLGIIDPMENGGADLGSTVVGVCGTLGAGEQVFPPATIRDRDFYVFDIPAGFDAEALVFVEQNYSENTRLLDTDDLDPGGVCDFNTQGLGSFTLNGGICDGGTTFGISGLQTTGLSNCLDAGESHYMYLAPFGEPACDVEYRFEIQLYECRLGACCLDNSLCVGDNDIGFLECEAIAGGTFVAGASCPTGDLEGTLCLGVCCLDDDMNPVTPTVCVTDTLYQDCCLGNGALLQQDPDAPGYAQGEFLGYQVGDTPAACSPNACVPSGACCVDSSQGYDCFDDQTPAQCTGLGGLYQGDGTLCADSPCDALLGGCCVGVACLDAKSPLECVGLGGSFQGVGTLCATTQCAQTGACCWACPDGATCVDGQTREDCRDTLQGMYAGDGSSCGAICDTQCKGDLDGNGTNDVFDFGIFSGNFGTLVGGTRCEGDLDCNGTIDVFDFGTYAGDFGCLTGANPGSCAP